MAVVAWNRSLDWYLIFFVKSESFKLAHMQEQISRTILA